MVFRFQFDLIMLFTEKSDPCDVFRIHDTGATAPYEPADGLRPEIDEDLNISTFFCSFVISKQIRNRIL